MAHTACTGAPPPHWARGRWISGDFCATLSTVECHRSGTPTPTPTRRYKEEAQAQRKEIYKLEKEREKYGAEASEATSKYLQAQLNPTDPRCTARWPTGRTRPPALPNGVL